MFKKMNPLTLKLIGMCKWTNLDAYFSKTMILKCRGYDKSNKKNNYQKLE